jgi:hypothetical protein
MDPNFANGQILERTVKQKFGYDEPIDQFSNKNNTQGGLL